MPGWQPLLRDGMPFERRASLKYTHEDIKQNMLHIHYQGMMSLQEWTLENGSKDYMIVIDPSKIDGKEVDPTVNNKKYLKLPSALWKLSEYTLAKSKNNNHQGLFFCIECTRVVWALEWPHKFEIMLPFEDNDNDEEEVMLFYDSFVYADQHHRDIRRY